MTPKKQTKKTQNDTEFAELTGRLMDLASEFREARMLEQLRELLEVLEKDKKLVKLLKKFISAFEVGTYTSKGTTDRVYTNAKAPRADETLLVRLGDRDMIALHLKAFKRELGVAILVKCQSFAEFADRAGMTAPGVSRMLSSSSLPHPNTLAKIARVLELDHLKLPLSAGSKK